MSTPRAALGDRESGSGRRLASAAQVAAGLALVSLAWYAMTSLIAQRGHVRFYSLDEHGVMLAYCAISYVACRASWRRWPAPAGTAPWRSVIASYGIAGVLGSAVFITMRLRSSAEVVWDGVLLNAAFVLLTLHSMIAGIWFLARYYALRLEAVTARGEAERAAAHSELRRLQQQVDPHFLFNSLSILSSLVRRDPERAELFSQRLTSFYRYLLHHNDAEWVHLDDEIAFAHSYVHLLDSRFGAAFRVTIALPPGSGYFVIPGLLQELLNNVVKHNHASEDQPVEVALTVEGERLIASNSLRPRGSAEPRSGRGLAALSERYALLTGERLAWSARADRFVVEVPLFASAP
jgi:hypothetical protein